MKRHRIGRTDCNAGATVVTFLTKIISQWIETKFTNSSALGAIVTVFHNTFYSEQAITPDQRI